MQKTRFFIKVIFFDRIYGLAGLALVCIVSAFFMVMAIGKIAVVQSLIMAVFFTTAALILLLMPKRLGFTQYCLKISQRLPLRLRKVIFWIDQLRESISQQSRLDILLLIGVSIIIHLLVIVQTYLVGHILLPGKINLFICFLAVPPALLVSYLPISIAGWGVREASMVVAFGIFGVSAPIAIIISLFVGLTVLLVSCVGGLLWLLGWRSDKKELCTNDI